MQQVKSHRYFSEIKSHSLSFLDTYTLFAYTYSRTLIYLCKKEVMLLIPLHLNLNTSYLKLILRPSQMTFRLMMGILRSQVGGSQSGFILARDPSKITMFEIVNVLKDDLQMFSCRDSNDSIKCEIANYDHCSIYNIFNCEMLKIDEYIKKLRSGSTMNQF